MRHGIRRERDLHRRYNRRGGRRDADDVHHDEPRAAERRQSGVQVAERATQLAQSFAEDRIQSPAADGSSARAPVAIIRHPDVKRMLVRMKALTQAARALVYYAAAQADRAESGDPLDQRRLELLTPLGKAYATDVGCEVASLGVQVHGGAGYIEDAEAAQHYRDARILPIYEGMNGIQAADLVNRKQAGDRQAAFLALIHEIEADTDAEPKLDELRRSVLEIGSWMAADAAINDRLAGSYPFLTMLAALVSAGSASGSFAIWPNTDQTRNPQRSAKRRR